MSVSLLATQTDPSPDWLSRPLMAALRVSLLATQTDPSPAAMTVGVQGSEIIASTRRGSSGTWGVDDAAVVVVAGGPVTTIGVAEGVGRLTRVAGLQAVSPTMIKKSVSAFEVLRRNT